MAAIEFRNVSKSFGKTAAVDNVSFRVEDGEFFCFFGPPLSGKSTILRLILGLETPDVGEILFDGRPVNRIGPAGRNVAMVFQNLALFPHLSAADNIRFPLRERKTDPAVIEKRLAEVAEKLHIGHILHKLPAHLSGGERQRVAIGRALVREPVAYLMDDPISALDARLREETRVELKRMQTQLGRTLVYVTHDQEEAMSIADRMAIMENGQIRQIATPAEAYDRPQSGYVAGLLGAPAINIFAIAANQSGNMLQLAGGTVSIAAGAVPPGTVSIGVRPEHLRLAPAGQGVDATVFEVEPLGGFTVVTLAAGGQRLRALMRGQPQIVADSQVGLLVDPATAHFFGPDGRALAVHP
jgi:multiple sugar transport system ATP-binding protein